MKGFALIRESGREILGMELRSAQRGSFFSLLFTGRQSAMRFCSPGAGLRHGAKRRGTWIWALCLCWTKPPRTPNRTMSPS